MELNNSKLDATSAYRIQRICKSAGGAFQKAKDYEVELQKLHCNLDEKGNVVLKPLDVPGLPPGAQKPMAPDFKSEADAKEFDAKMTAYFASTFIEVKVHKLQFSSLCACGVQLTGVEMAAIEEMLDGVPDEV